MPPGWYQDPRAPDLLRWWDGTAWTEHVQPAPSASNPPPFGTVPFGTVPVGTVPFGTAPAGPRPTNPLVIVGAVVGVLALVALVCIVAVTMLGTNKSATPRSSSGSSSGGAGPAAPETETERRAAEAGIPMLDTEGAVTHTHTLLRVDVRGYPFPVAANVGIDSRTGRIAAVHTHDGSGVVHVESPEPDDRYTLGEFIILWGMGADEPALCQRFISGPCTVRVEVVAPDAEARKAFERLGGVPEEPPVDAAGLDTELAQGAVIEVHIEPTT